MMTASDSDSNQFYRRSLELMEEAEVPFLLGGAYAFCVYTGIVRQTKDFDLFVKREDFERALAVFARLPLSGSSALPRPRFSV